MITRVAVGQLFTHGLGLELRVERVDVDSLFPDVGLSDALLVKFLFDLLRCHDSQVISIVAEPDELPRQPGK